MIPSNPNFTKLQTDLACRTLRYYYSTLVNTSKHPVQTTVCWVCIDCLF